ncbi:putative transcriptional regulator [Acidovorax sp. CF316]|uniref:ArsR/SmtB family transcription factor n=1 Tax=Acidovorax sp. CF316 TaxID=1144317 RepID=UPI00026BE7C7|nr:helix-turn-helix domain-containing protein [Acidovorax sp. CF316]EJE51022.1 putative transcriptional regulator [Acidovorax sp. CF316]
MQKAAATTVFESLSSPVRLDVFRLLVRQGPGGLVAGEIAAALDVPPTNLSFHLKGMTHATLLTVEQEGRYQRYRANLALMAELIGYLTEECCAGNPGLCAELPGKGGCAPAAPATPTAAGKRRKTATAA